jgi:hypothetical protein
MTGNALWLVFLALTQGFLALALVFYLGAIRVPLILNGKVRIADIALDSDAWPTRARQVSNALDNQFQLPVLFYVGVFAAILLVPTLFEVIVAALFVVSRYAHAFIHVTTNNVMRRFQAYVVGLGLLCLLWVDLLVRVVLVAFGVV